MVVRERQQKECVTLTSANAWGPEPTAFNAENGIVVNGPRQSPLGYRLSITRRVSACDDQDSRYEITYRLNLVT
jgi:hypothetical protein